jgi:UDP-N-acetylmuramoyl-L-alanine---L-glutamate ligase
VLTLPDSGPRISAAFESAGAPGTPGAPGAPDPGAGGSSSGGSAVGGFAGTSDCPDLDAAVATGFGWARPSGIVLLSPAAPSFGRFRDYRDRAEAFARAMRACAPA